MAYLYKRKRSPYFWLGFNENGKQKSVSTGYRYDRGDDVRRAQKMKLEKSIEELNQPDAGDGETGWSWVSNFLKIKYSPKPQTLERYECAWATIKLFLEEKEILGAVQLARRHCFDYVAWRGQAAIAGKAPTGKYKACHNTALLELKILRLIMQEAVERELCPGNPCVNLGLKKAPRKKAPELTKDQYELIRSKIPDVADPAVREMLTNSLEIAWYQGTRTNGTRVHVHRDVNLETMTIRFTLKGGRILETALHPNLVPFFTKLRSEGKTWTWSPPDRAARTWASAKWFKFLDRHGLKKEIHPDVCLRSTRVSVVSRLTKAGVPLDLRMAYVGHTSASSHQDYQRITASDVKVCTDVLK